MKSPQKNYSKNEIQLAFFLLIIPVIILGELIKVLHRVGNNGISHNGLGINQGYVRTTDDKKISVKYTKKFDKCVVLVHGYLSSSKRSILKYSEKLCKNKFDFIAVDLRNHGQSSLSLPISAGYYERLDLMAVLKWANIEWKQVHILSTSMGSYATIYSLAELNDQYQPKSVILESFGVDIKLGTRDTLTLLYNFPPLLSALITSYAHLRSPYMFIRDVRLYLKKIQIPILVAHGDRDQIYSSETIQSLLRKILPVRTQFITVSGAEHSELWRTKKFQNIIIKFFNE